MGRLIYCLDMRVHMVDLPSIEAQDVVNESYTDERDSLELMRSSENSERVKRVAIAAVFAAASIAIAPISAFIPRIPGWDIAFFDPVSFFWIAAFLIGGLWIGLTSSVAGMIGLFFFDPSLIGPFFKFEATFVMIIIPWLIVKRFGKHQGGSYLRLPKVYIASLSLAAVVRISVMVVTNLVVVPILWGPFFTIEFIIAYALLINGFQSVLDALIPYLVVHGTPIFKRFGMW
jgi:hypothetical protein